MGYENWRVVDCEIDKREMFVTVGGINGARDFKGFTVSLLAVNHRETRCRLLFILEVNTGKFASEQTRQVSFTKRLGLQLTENGKLLMYNKKRGGGP